MKTATSIMVLCADTAADVMRPNPITVLETATLQEAVLSLTESGISGLAVIDEAGRPVGVLSQSDVLRHDHPRMDVGQPHYYARAELTLASGEHLPKDFQVGEIDRTLVRDVMTPVVYSVCPEAPVSLVVEQMVVLGVHRVFVIDREDRLVGIISTLDLLRCLRPEG